MSLFTPLTGILGGALIGSSAGLLLVLNGDIMGISGILNGSLGHPEGVRDPKSHWRWVYLASFALAVNMYVNYLTPDVALRDDRSAKGLVPSPSSLAHILGGLLVGIGTRIGNGCTTGHGICGLGRQSLRSLVATCTFTGLSIVTTYMISQARSWSSWTDVLRTDHLPLVSPLASAAVTGSLCLIAMTRPVEHADVIESKKSWGAAISGSMFAMGLAVSGMTQNSKVHDFLCFSKLATASYDPTLMAVMISGIGSSWLAYQAIHEFSVFGATPAVQPLALPQGCKFGVPTNQAIDARLLIGTTIFGVGWGLTGICPGPALYAAAAGIIEVIVLWMPSFLIGSEIGKRIVEEVWEKKPKQA